MTAIHYIWFDGSSLQHVDRDFVPRVGDHVVLRGEHEPMKVQEVLVDENANQVQVILNVGDY